MDPTDDYTDPSTNAVHPIDGVDVWTALAAGTDGVTDPVREWLPTTERSLLWNDGKGHMWKLITSGRWLQSGTFELTGEFLANRFHRNGTQYMDQDNTCSPATADATAHGTRASTLSCTGSHGVSLPCTTPHAACGVLFLVAIRVEC